jgi:hypothetical protein
MKTDAVKAMGLILAGFSLSACALGPTTALNPDARRQALARQIADDASAFNEAYAQAVSSQILLNILRARDRLPRYYLSMTGISDAPSVRLRGAAGIGGVLLGEGAPNWGIGNLGIERETQSRPSYAVQPFDAETLTRAAFQPTEPYVFAHYWRSGWPRDLLLLLMVDRIEKTDANGHVQIYDNEANEISYNCAERVETGGCSFVHEMRAFLSDASAMHPAPLNAPQGQAICGVIEAYEPTTPVRAIAPAEGQVCAPVFVVGSNKITLRLRSLDDIVYYVGELLRVSSTNAEPGAAVEAQVDVRAAGLRGGGAGVPLFRILPEDNAGNRSYAASISYGGERFVAGPAIGRSCREAREDGPCRDDAEHGDRTSSVLSLIAELMALNQSPDSIRAPDRLIAE